MRKRPPFPALLVLALPLLWAEPAAASLQYTRVNRFFEGRDGVLIVHGSVPNQRVLSIGDPRIDPDPDGEGDVATILMYTQVELGAAAEIAKQVVLPQLKPGISRVVVVGEDVSNGFRTEYMNYGIFPDPPLEIELDRTRLTSAETLKLRARFEGTDGGLPGTFTVEGRKIRVQLGIGCFNCPIPLPTQEYDLSAELGPFPAGEWTLEVWGDDGVGEQLNGVYFHRQKLSVLPSPAAVRDGRFTIEIPLDPPHAAEGRLVGPPSEDSALFYFFSPDNWEVMVKVLDGCAINGFYWVFGAASTDVGYTVTVRDTLGGGSREYRHPAGTPAPAITDLAAFACGAAEGGRP